MVTGSSYHLSIILTLAEALTSGLEKNSRGPETSGYIPLSHGPERGWYQLPPRLRWEETGSRMARASPRQHRAVGEVGLGAPYLFTQCNQVPTSHFPPQGCLWILGSQTHMTCLGLWTTGWGHNAGEKGELGPGWGNRCSKKPDSQDCCLFGPLPFPKHPQEPQDDFDKHLSNFVFAPLAGLPGVKQAGEINSSIQVGKPRKRQRPSPRIIS